ncbi:hypothetical protein [Stratiformator vulcanicus]|uniref:Uncharacterized protein n=1 Tax=Stratiformator vulcanicus TaxID=2527980 RepID=A0A517R367_9PLAN|nr:hypothetical protein [Stratiformator vulcanicus]QDT38304.1 hypothetical protein Pan189_26950 [Stratiformator vulcanicus]
MKLPLPILAFVLLIPAVGCGGRPEPKIDVDIAEPLSVERWRELPPNVQTEPLTLAKLRADNPALADDQGWKEFAATNLPDDTTDGGN